MGQAFDDKGQLMGNAFGDTKAEVFQKLNEQFPTADEIRIKHLRERLRDAEGVSTPMPRYQSHKKVWALKIAEVTLDSDGSAILTPSESPYAPFKVDAAYVRKHAPQAGGYFVQYEDGYKSFSPAEAFESGYTRL